MSTRKRVSFSDRGYAPSHSTSEEEDEPPQPLEDHGDAYLSSFSDPNLRQPSIPPRVAYHSDGTASIAAATSPTRKKISALQDRRVNEILLEALQLVDCSQEELAVIEKSVKKLRDTIYGFSILVDKQVNIIGTETLEERGRIRADIQDLAGTLRHSYDIFETTCDRMRSTLSSGKLQIQSHKKRVGAISPTKASRQGGMSPSGKSPGSPQRMLAMVVPSTSASIVEGGLSFSPTCGRVPLMAMIGDQQEETGESGGVAVFMTADFFASLMKSVGLDENEFLDPKDLVRFVQEMLTFSIAKSHTLTFMGKAFHRRLIPTYARDLVHMIARDLQLDTSVITALPYNTVFDYMCGSPYCLDRLLDRLYVADGNHYTGEVSTVASSIEGPAANPFTDQFSRNGGVLHDSKIVQTLLVNRLDAEQLETAEQTLAMAKLLHDLATAENEAKDGSRLSFRSQPARTNEFSRVYLAASKDLLSKGAGVN